MYEDQFGEEIKNIINERSSIFHTDISITRMNKLPGNGIYPLKDNFWYQIPDVICVYVDMKNSTKLSISAMPKATAAAYELFTGGAVDIFHNFEASYVDVKGDGVFALFNQDENFRAFAAAITFKTFASQTFKPLISKKVNSTDVNVGVHIGLDKKTVLVKQIGIRNDSSRDSRKNEVWAGKTINMAAKLASLSNDDEIYVSDRFFDHIQDSEEVVKSCGCENGVPTRQKTDLWATLDISDDDKFDFDTVHILKSVWCSNHGKDWCKKILALDNK